MTNIHEQIMNFLKEQSIYLLNMLLDNFIHSTLKIPEILFKFGNKKFLFVSIVFFKFITDIDFNSKIKIFNSFIEKYPHLSNISQ